MNYFCFQWELDLLTAIQGLHATWLTPILYWISQINMHGEFWMCIGAVLFFIPKTRKCGLTMLLAMIIGSLTTDIALKHLVARARPYAYVLVQNAGIDASMIESYIFDPTFTSQYGFEWLLQKLPSDFSFPSGHCVCGFAASTSLYHNYKKPGIAALCLASLIAFARLYLFVHFPTDVVAGILIGIISACISIGILKLLLPKINSKKVLVYDPAMDKKTENE